MLTQCPECNTTFHLHLKQLKAAGGKVRCSRCNATFDALDNLISTPAVSEEAPPKPSVPEVVVAQAPPPPPAFEQSTTSAPQPEQESRPEPATEQTSLEVNKERITSRFDEEETVTPPPATTEEDALAAFIDELASSTSHHEMEAVAEDEPLLHADDAPTTDDELLHAAFNSIELAEDEALPLVEPDAITEPHFDVDTKELSIELEDDELLPLVEPEAITAPEFDVDTEELSIELAEEEPLPLVEPEVIAAPDLDGDTEELSIELVEEEPLPLVEPEAEVAETIELAPEEPATSEEEFANLFEESEPEAEAGTIELAFEEPVIIEEEFDSFFEESEPETEAAETLELAPEEPATSEEEFANLFEESEPEAEAGTIELAFEEPVIIEEEFDSFFEESEPETEAAETLELAPEEPVTSEEVFTNLFEESEPEAEAGSLELAPEGPAIIEEEFDSFFIESEPEAEAVETLELAREEPTIIEEKFDSLFEGSERASLEEPASGSIEVAESEAGDEAMLTAQETMFDLFDESPVDGPTQDAIDLADETVPDEAEEPPAPGKPAANPLAPFSEEPIGNLGPPSVEEENTPTPQVGAISGDELELYSFSAKGAEAPRAEESVEPVPSASSPGGYAIPAELTQAKQASSRNTLLWGLGIVLMCAGLVLQYLYYFRLQLVDNPQLRPVLSAMCSVTGCQLPPRRDLTHIELTEHLMQVHPTYEESLLLTATLANRADFDQPYPLLEVTMTDIEQQVVAQRRFLPEQYLNNFRSGDTFAAHSEVPLMLEVVDPGNSAVGFEFRFY